MVYIVIACAIVLVILLYLLALRGRRNHPGWAALSGWSYAHRGLHGEGKPENSMAAFRAALENGYGIELDVHLLKDGSLAVIHDSLLKRTTGAEGRIEELTADQLENYRLEGTEETIPTFSQVLQLFDGKAPMIVELKCENGNYVPLCKAVCQLLDTYNGPYCIESFDPRCIIWLRKHRPDIIRGQLSENYFRIDTDVSCVIKFIMTHHLVNFLIVPDFIAYRFADRKSLGNFLVRRLWGVKGVSWTLRTPAEYESAVSDGWIPIFEKFIPHT